MSSDETPNVPTTRNSRDAVREKAQQVQAKQARLRVVRLSTLGLGAVLVVAALGVGVAMAIGSSAGKTDRTPLNMQGDGILVREVAASAVKEVPSAVAADPTEATPAPDRQVAEGAVDIHIYVDYLSPGSGKFERANARQLADWIDQGAANVSYHPVALLTANSNGTKYSLRAASAAACVASYSKQHFYAYNHELLLDQPTLDTDGLSDVVLADIAVAVGVDAPKGIRACIEEKAFASWAKDATKRALEGPLPGSDKLVLNSAPMIIVNGQAYIGALDDPDEFAQFVSSVASDAYYGKITPTPGSTPSPSETTPAS